MNRPRIRANIKTNVLAAYFTRICRQTHLRFCSVQNRGRFSCINAQVSFPRVFHNHRNYTYVWLCLFSALHTKNQLMQHIIFVKDEKHSRFQILTRASFGCLFVALFGFCALVQIISLEITYLCTAVYFLCCTILFLKVLPNLSNLSRRFVVVDLCSCAPFYGCQDRMSSSIHSTRIAAINYKQKRN